MLQWIPLIKRIQAAGKSIQLFATWPHEMLALMEELKPEGLLFTCRCVEELEAKALVEQVAKWTKQRPV